MRLAALRARVGWPLNPARLPVWFDRAYRFPLASAGTATELALSRSELAAWYLLDRLAWRIALRTPEPADHAALERVHPRAYLESLASPELLARIFGCAPSEVPVDEVLGAARLAVGGTLAAAGEALRARRPMLNLAGGFHHAAPARGGGFCVINDVAVALAAVRAEGFSGRAVVLDLDAHPPDGTAACLRGDRACWVGSLDGSDWGRLEGVHQMLLPQRAGDAGYLAALDALLREMPRAGLAFVLAGGDVLAGDPLGALGLTLEGARERDRRVLAALAGVPSVWLPAGGYSAEAWRVLAGTALVLCGVGWHRIPAGYDPLHTRFARISNALSPERLGGGIELAAEDLEADLHLRPRRPKRLFDFYSAEGIEYALYQYGFSDRLAQLGYLRPRVELGAADLGQRVRVYARGGGGEEYLVAECVLERRAVAEEPVLYIHWLTLRHPLARFTRARPQLPGQDVPGLGLSREAVEMLGQMAARLGLAGLAFRPAHLHAAYAARRDFEFVDPERQGRFEALLRDLGDVPLLALTRAVDAGAVLLDGRRYGWEADEMVRWLSPHPREEARVALARAHAHFTLAPRIDELAATQPPDAPR